MAYKAPKVNIKGASGGLILKKVIQADKSGYLAGLPLETETTAGFMSAARLILASENRMNAVIAGLQNRFFMVMILSLMFNDEWEKFTEKGILEDGEGMEEIYVGLVEPEQYKWTEDINDTMKALFGKRQQEVASAFHAINFEKRYAVTISYDELRKALRSPGQLEKFTREKSEGALKSYKYDNYLLNKYMLYRLGIDGKLFNLTVPELDRSTAGDAVINIQALIEDATHMRSTYTISKLPQTMAREKAVVARTSKFAAYVNVDILANAFNMQKAEYARRQLGIDGFNEADIERLNKLLKEDESYVPFTPDELDMINNNIYGFMFDEDFFINHVYLFDANDWVYNGAERYRNNFLHIWKVQGVSPFKTAVMITSETGEITAITVNPVSMNMYPGTRATMSVNVTKTGIIDSDVTWSVDVEPSVAYILPDGTLYISDEATAGTKITVTATSVADDTITGTSTVNVTANA